MVAPFYKLESSKTKDTSPPWSHLQYLALLLRFRQGAAIIARLEEGAYLAVTGTLEEVLFWQAASQVSMAGTLSGTQVNTARTCSRRNTPGMLMVLSHNSGVLVLVQLCNIAGRIYKEFKNLISAKSRKLCKLWHRRNESFDNWNLILKSPTLQLPHPKAGENDFKIHPKQLESVFRPILFIKTWYVQFRNLEGWTSP